MRNFDLIIKNANLASFADNAVAYGLIPNAVIACHQGKISWLGTQKEFKQLDYQAKKLVDAKGCLLTPGLIDCHTHIVFAGSRAVEFERRLKGVSYEEIAQSGGGILSTVNATRKAGFDELYVAAESRIKHLISQGVTTVEIKSGYGLDLDTEIKMLKVAKALGEHLPIDVKTTLLAAHALPPEYKNDRSAYVDLICKKIIPEVAKLELADAVDAFCENIGFTYNETRRIFEAASRWGLPVKLHADQLSNLKGAALVAEFGGLSADHVEYTDEASIRKMAEFDAVATLLPYAYYALQETQKPSVELFRKYGVDMAVASDCNPGTAPTTNLLQCLHMACCQFGLTPEEALLGATRNAAKALACDDEKGTLEVGKLAQMVLWNITEPAELIYWQGENRLKQVFR
ncbi:MAG: imidazolonepropionase [Proteobacteria bacterium]|nr:imidazolonepropionase [Pseudomonadota bacterium]